MTITYILSTDIGKIRLLISDTAGAQFSDEELQVFLDMSDDDVYTAAAMALEAWAAAITGNVTSEKIGDYAYSKKESDNKLALAARYRSSAGSVPVIDWAEMDLEAVGEYPVEESEE